MPGLVTSLKMMMIVGVLNFAVLQVVPPNECSTLVVKGQICCIDASCHLLEYEELVLVFLTCVDLPVPSSLPGTLVFARTVLPACSRQDSVHEAYSHFFLSATTVRCGLCRNGPST